MRHGTMIIRLAVLIALLAPGATLAEKYTIVGPESEVVFESSAPMETFTGHTAQISGWFEADPGKLLGAVDLQVTVDLASFDTGLGKRNQHMRDNHLETDRFPTAVFRAGTVARAVPEILQVGQPAVLTLRGTLALHGVNRDMQCDLTVTLAGDGSLRVQGEFPVLLSEHDIPRPKFLVLKVADEQKVRVDLMARPQSTGVQP